MKGFFRAIAKYMKLEWMFIRMNLRTQTTYRMNFFFGFFLNVVWVIGKALYAAVAYALDVPLAGLTADEVLLFIGSGTIVQAIYTAFALVGLQTMLPNAVRSGSLDLLLVKPVSLQFYMSLCYVEFPTMLGDLLGGAGMIAVALSRMTLTVTAGRVLMYLLFLTTSAVTMYCVTFLIQLLVFRHIQTSGISQISGELGEINRLPMHIYPRRIRTMLLIFPPILLFSNIASMYLVGQLSPLLGIWAVLAPAMLFTLGRILWKRELRHYSSANG